MSAAASLSAGLRERGAAAWAAATSHPMVRQIGAGTLPHQTFRRYFEQNVLYLADYARAIGLIIGKAPDLAALDVLSRFLGQITTTEIPANLAFLRRLGGSPAPTMLPVTYAYTRHLLYTAAQGTCAEGLTAVLPCQWSYGELARPLMAAPPADPVYADWIAMFGNDAYGDLVDETTGLLDRLAGEGPGKSDPGGVHSGGAGSGGAGSGGAGSGRADSGAAAGRLSAIFDVSTEYEVQFWDMAYGVPGGTSGGKEPGHTCELPESSKT